ncbi:MAG: synthase [Pseudomonadota bacterium]
MAVLYAVSRDARTKPFGPHVLNVDYGAEERRIEGFLAQAVARGLNRRGVVVGVSGGIDSSVCVTLATRALGASRVLALLMPEKEGSDDAMERAKRLCERLGVTYITEDIGPTLAASGSYARRDAAIRQMLPEFAAGWRHKIIISGMFDRARIPHFHLVAEAPDGVHQTLRMPTDIYLQVVAATNYKQRIRKMTEYYHAERLNYAVIGTPNRLEYELGFFVRGGDGLADVKPIAHLYKTQVYAMAAHLGVPEEIRRQPPSTDTYTLPQSQEEFYFALPYPQADLLLYAMNNGIAPEATAPVLHLDLEQVAKARTDFAAKKKAARRILRDALLITDPEVGAAAPQPEVAQ